MLTGTPPGVGCFRKPPLWLKVFTTVNNIHYSLINNLCSLVMSLIEWLVTRVDPTTTLYIAVVVYSLLSN